MRKTKFTEEEIVFALQHSENGVKIKEIYRRFGISKSTFYNWKRKYSGLGVTQVKIIKDLQEENKRLHKIVSELTLDKQRLQYFLKNSV